MDFDPKREARVGAKRLRQRQDKRMAKRYIQGEYELELESDYEGENRDFQLNIKAEVNRKWRYRD